MPLLDIDWSPEPKKLRVFAIAFVVFAALLGAFLTFVVGLPVAVGVAVWAAGAAVLLAGLLIPSAVLPIYVVLTAVTLPIGFVLATLILALTYYAVLTPIGLVRRLFGSDPAARRFDPDANSYWSPRATVTDVKRYFRQS